MVRGYEFPFLSWPCFQVVEKRGPWLKKSYMARKQGALSHMTRTCKTMGLCGNSDPSHRLGAIYTYIGSSMQFLLEKFNRVAFSRIQIIQALREIR